MFSCLQILEAFLWFVLITLLNVTLIILTLSVSRLLNLLLRLVAFLLDRKSGSAGMPRPISYAVFCLKKKNNHQLLDVDVEFVGLPEQHLLVSQEPGPTGYSDA